VSASLEDKGTTKKTGPTNTKEYLSSQVADKSDTLFNHSK